MPDDAIVAGMVLQGLLDNAEQEIVALRQQLNDAMILSGLLLQRLGGRVEVDPNEAQTLGGLSVVQEEDPLQLKWIFVLRNSGKVAPNA